MTFNNNKKFFIYLIITNLLFTLTFRFLEKLIKPPIIYVWNFAKKKKKSRFKI